MFQTYSLFSGAYYADCQMQPVSIQGHVKQRTDEVFQFADHALRKTLEAKKKRS